MSFHVDFEEGSRSLLVPVAAAAVLDQLSLPWSFLGQLYRE